MAPAKLFGFIPLPARWTREAWSDHYASRHGPLVAGTVQFSRHFSRYEQNLVVDGAGTAQSSDIVAISELWVRDISDIARAYAEPSYESDIRPDEKSFTDASQVLGGVAEERVIAAGAFAPDACLKVFVRRKLRPGIDFSEARDNWVEAGRARFSQPFSRIGVRYVQTYPIEPGAWPGFDMIDIFHWPDANSSPDLQQVTEANIAASRWFTDPTVVAARSRVVFAN